MSGRLVPVAIKKELRALAPGWLACLALFAAAALITLAGEIAAALKFGADLTLAANAVAFKSAFLWRGMLGISTVAAVCAWRLFMRLEAIDGRGQAFSLPWGNAGTTATETVP